MARSGANLALLLLGGFQALADAATEELARRGHKDFRPAHDFAMRAIASGADDASKLGRRLSVTKQAAAKTIAALQERGYVERDADEEDARRKRLRVTALGFEVLAAGEKIFDGLREQWEQQVGRKSLKEMERCLTLLLECSPGGTVDSGWLAKKSGSSGPS